MCIVDAPCWQHTPLFKLNATLVRASYCVCVLCHMREILPVGEIKLTSGSIALQAARHKNVQAKSA